MQITDPIADMLTRIRNAGSAKHETVDVPASKMKKSIAEILLNEGYIYAGADELPRLPKRLGIAIISTSKGVMTDKEARKANVGGEVLAFVW